MPGFQRLNCIKHQRDSRLHVEHAGTVQAAIRDMATHLGKRAQRIYRVEMAKQENGLYAWLAGKINLDVVRMLFSSVYCGSATDRSEFVRQDRSHMVAGSFAIAGGFDFNELTDRLHQRILAGFEITQAFGPFAVRCALGLAFCLMSWHLRFSWFLD